ncbi:MAG: antitoxin Xre/MbcA/ParS toxin-binding domain-containing protein [Trueperaceae bacterium]
MLTFTTSQPVRFVQAERMGRQVGLLNENLAAFLGISPKTYSRRRREGKLDTAESLRLEMLEKMYTLAQDVLGGEDRAKRWLTGPLTGLGNKAPLELLTSIQGYETVRNALYRQAYGMF